ncbi:MAG: LysR family transcriptional regulator [Geminicoccaceae bacterium]
MPIHAVFLKYFDEVWRSGSIRMAARKLHVASSAVNRQILKIEDELGVKLFKRVASGIRLTAAGELLAEHVTRTLGDADHTMARIAALKGEQGQLVSIAGQESVIARFLPPALVALHAEYPDIATVFKAASGTELQHLLRIGSADIAIAFDPEPADDIETVASVELPVGAVLTPAHPLADRASLSLEECASYPIVLPDQSWPLRAKLDGEIGKADLAMNIVTSSNSVEFLKAMVDQQLGIGFQTLVGIEAQIERGELSHVLLVTTAPVKQAFALCVCSDRLDTPAFDHLITLLQQRLTDYEDASPKPAST